MCEELSRLYFSSEIMALIYLSCLDESQGSAPVTFIRHSRHKDSIGFVPKRT